MQKQTSVVNKIGTTSIEFSAIFNIGDTVTTNQKSKAIAVQKEGTVFTEKDNKYFKDYPIFKRKAVWPDKRPNVTINTKNHDDMICVNQVNIIGVTTSSIFQVGSINQITAESRVKHFRFLRD